MQNERKPTQNLLLASLPPNELVRLIPLLRPMALPSGAVVYSIGDPIDFIYFPSGELMAEVAMLDDAQGVEVWPIGREGANRRRSSIWNEHVRARCRSSDRWGGLADRRRGPEARAAILPGPQGSPGPVPQSLACANFSVSRVRRIVRHRTTASFTESRSSKDVTWRPASRDHKFDRHAEEQRAVRGARDSIEIIDQRLKNLMRMRRISAMTP